MMMVKIKERTLSYTEFYEAMHRTAGNLPIESFLTLLIDMGIAEVYMTLKETPK